MNDEQWKGLYCYFSNWFNMANVAFLMVGAFQEDHVFGGLIGASISGLMGLMFKIKMNNVAIVVIYVCLVAAIMLGIAYYRIHIRHKTDK